MTLRIAPQAVRLVGEIGGPGVEEPAHREARPAEAEGGPPDGTPPESSRPLEGDSDLIAHPGGDLDLSGHGQVTIELDAQAVRPGLEVEAERRRPLRFEAPVHIDPGTGGRRAHRDLASMGVEAPGEGRDDALDLGALCRIALQPQVATIGRHRPVELPGALQGPAEVEGEPRRRGVEVEGHLELARGLRVAPVRVQGYADAVALVGHVGRVVAERAHGRGAAREQPDDQRQDREGDRAYPSAAIAAS